MSRFVWMCSALTLLGAACADQPPEQEPPPPCDAVDVRDCLYPSKGYQVADVEGYTIHDDTTGRDLPIKVRYPTAGTGPFPVIIWSHGGEFNDTGHRSYVPWGTALAAQGYVVVHVAHVEPDAEQTARLCELAGIPAAECAGAIDPRYVLAHAYDAVAVMDDLPDIASWLVARSGPAMDLETLSVCGHSGGSMQGLTFAGSTRALTSSVPRWSLADARPPVTVALSPQGPGFMGYFDDGDETSMDHITQPVLVITGDNDQSANSPGLTPAVRRQTYDNLPGGTGEQRLLYSLLPLGTGHHDTYGLQDRDSPDEDLVRLTGAISSAVRAFLDRHLLGSEEAGAWLDSDAALRLAGTDLAEWLAR